MERRFGRLGHLVSITAAVGVGSMIAACQGEPPVPPSGPDPIVKVDLTPPPISGGTLLIATRTNPNLAVVSDTDRDKIWTVDLTTGVPIAHVDLKENDEPGRIVEDTHGQVHVALRRGGDIATVDLATMHVDRRHVCAAPRGLAYDETNDAVHVVCMNGELVTLPAKGGAATRVLHLDRDIQDVVLQGRGSPSSASSWSGRAHRRRRRRRHQEPGRARRSCTRRGCARWASRSSSRPTRPGGRSACPAVVSRWSTSAPSTPKS